MDTPRLLIVEDEPEIALMVSRIASEEGFSTSCAVGFADIQRTYLDFKPDVIVLDINMPDIDGLEVLQLLHSHFSTARIIILSGSEALSRRIAENMGNALGLTIAANLAKPFRVGPLRELFRGLKNTLPANSQISENHTETSFPMSNNQ